MAAWQWSTNTPRECGLRGAASSAASVKISPQLEHIEVFATIGETIETIGLAINPRAAPPVSCHRRSVGKRQHYVPRFYLRRFGSTAKQIDLLNLGSRKVVRNAALAKQCYEDHFYGKDGELEEAFAFMEAHTAALLEEIISRRAVPAPGSEGWRSLIIFLAFQKLRTQAAASTSDDLFAQGVKEVLAEHPRIDPEVLEAVRIENTGGLADSLNAAMDSAIEMDDLAPLLISSREHAFITSDDPVCSYNTFARQVHWQGTVGAACRGLQIVFPITPDLCLVLFDAGVYGASTKRLVHQATMHDVGHLNRLVASQAHENIYFGPWLSKRQAERIAKKVARARTTPRVKFAKADEVTDSAGQTGERSTLIHMYFPFPRTGFELSMLHLRPTAKAIPERSRGNMLRNPIRRQEGAKPPRAPGDPPRQWVERGGGARWYAS